MKKLSIILVVLAFILNFTSCDDASSKPNDPTSDYDYSETNPPAFATLATATYHTTLPDQKNYTGTIADEPAALFSAYTLTTGILYEDGTSITGYALEQFVDETAVQAATPDPDSKLGTSDARKLYAMVIRSNNDGFENRTKFVSKGYYNPDIRWDQFIQGYLLDLNYSGKSFFPASVGLAKMYNNKYSYDIYMFRKIDVKRPDSAGSIATFEVAATTDSYVSDTNYTTVTGGLTTTKFIVTTISFTNDSSTYTNVKAISLDQFLTDHITDSPSSYTYKIVAVDDFSRSGWTYDNMKQAYYLPDYDFICQVDSASSTAVSGTKINFPVRIEVIK